MGKFTNLVLIAAAAALIVIGVAAQTGTISMGGRPAHGAVAGGHATTSPQVSGPPPAASPAPSPIDQQPVAAPVAPPADQGGGDGGDGGD